jgi:hypothetical protein
LTQEGKDAINLIHKIIMWVAMTILVGIFGFFLNEYNATAKQVGINSNRLTRLETQYESTLKFQDEVKSDLSLILKKLDKHMENADGKTN